MSIFAGIGNLADDWLKLPAVGQPPYYRHRSAAIELSRREEPITNTLEFLQASYAQIDNNWRAAKVNYSKPPSRENWRWKRHLELAAGNESPELRLERAIVNACGDNWSNQMPTASGLVSATADKRAAVDLVHRDGSATYSLIELKVASDNPLFAAIEILMHGILYVWSRNHQVELGYDVHLQPVLAGNSVTLSVLAPAPYYSGYDLTNFGEAINRALEDFDQRRDLALAFEFSQLDAAYEAGSTPESTRLAVDGKRSVWVAPSVGI